MTEETTEPSIEELQAALAERDAEIADARDHIAKLNQESATRRLALKERERELADTQAAASEYEKRLSGTEETLSELQARLQLAETERAVDRAIADHGAIPELVRPMLTGAAEYRDGAVMVGDKPVSDYVASLREQERFEGVFRGRGQTGGGTRSSNAAKGTAPVPKKPRSEMSDAEKRDFILTHGIETYNSLPLGSLNGA
ncbi:hypothetical protein M0534_00855 [Methylonatrum kenyense]|uniref:hypothetical protein n=1 Tax=Methylonatrum kenyense TaxID=455253 RepID=UPI0020C101A8|nr:hypothetical protein [Methylonatrum kenyense]MCK8514881.1 hypothetical protein [Methylonatrum kenyense]